MFSYGFLWFPNDLGHHPQVYSILFDAWSNIVPLDSSGKDAPDEAPTSRYGVACASPVDDEPGGYGWG